MMKKYRLITLFVLLLSLFRVQAQELAFYPNYPLPQSPDTLRILAIGNSFSDDATEYLPGLLEAAGIQVVVADAQDIAGVYTSIEMIGKLIDEGHAYEKNGTVYFSTRSFKDYGELSHKNLDDLRSGFRDLKVSGEDEKEDPLDFVLWKPKKEGEPSWPSPWSDGRPGWHIECSVMAKRYLGDTIDIHAGGEDLIFPHHENEIAQSTCANGVPFAQYWMHNAFLNIDNKKMSKSLGNFFTVPHGVIAPPFGNFASALYFGCVSHRSMCPNEFWFGTSSMPRAR